MLKLARIGEKQKDDIIIMRLTLKNAKIRKERLSKLSRDTRYPDCDECDRIHVMEGKIMCRSCEMCHKNCFS